MDTPCGHEGSEGSKEKVDGAPPRGFLRFLNLTGLGGPRVVVGAFGASFDKTLPPWRAGGNPNNRAFGAIVWFSLQNTVRSV